MAITSIAAAGAAKALMAVTISLQPAAAAHGSGHITVKPGNTLSSIAKKEYGKAADWPALWWTNRHSVHNPEVLQVGERLKVSSKPKLTAAVRKAAMAAIPAPAPAPAPVQAAAAPVSSAPAAPAAPATTSYTGSGGFQSCVIARESGGNASAVNPSSGAGGLYGFLPSTWHALGYSGLPQDASVSQQNAAFAKEYAQSGGGAWSAYDGC
jgi:resuscitation-promoting factor RpfC